MSRSMYIAIHKSLRSRAHANANVRVCIRVKLGASWTEYLRRRNRRIHNHVFGAGLIGAAGSDIYTIGETYIGGEIIFSRLLQARSQYGGYSNRTHCL